MFALPPYQVLFLAYENEKHEGIEEFKKRLHKKVDEVTAQHHQRVVDGGEVLNISDVEVIATDEAITEILAGQKAVMDRICDEVSQGSLAPADAVVRANVVLAAQTGLGEMVDTFSERRLTHEHTDELHAQIRHGQEQVAEGLSRAVQSSSPHSLRFDEKKGLVLV